MKKTMDAKIDALQSLLKIHLGDHESGIAKRYAVEWKMTNGRKEKTVTYEGKEPGRAKSVKIKKLKEVTTNVA